MLGEKVERATISKAETVKLTKSNPDNVIPKIYLHPEYVSDSKALTFSRFRLASDNKFYKKSKYLR